MPISNLSSPVFTAAEAYFALGYAVIPLHGDADPARAKVAAVPWKAYQEVKPALSDLREWFSNESFAALGIVTGKVSRLVVLDFDAPEHFRAFQSRFPDLAQNHVVATLRGFHIYFRLPLNMYVPSRKGQGVDLLSDGCYVVARPSTIAGHTYKLVKGGQPRILSVPDLHAITAFLDSHQSPAISFQFPVSSSQNAPESPADSSNSAPSSNSVPLALAALYRYLAAKGDGRNRALFIASIAARDHGWSLEKTLETLVELHAAQSINRSHSSESPDVRRREAQQTICSAYSRPARPLRQRKGASNGQGGAHGLPNTVREDLLKRKCTSLIRLWEGLHAKSIYPGTMFTAAQATKLLKGVVGRDSIYISLNTFMNGEPLFERPSPSAHPQASGDAAINTENETPNKCVFGRAEKPGKNPKGRPNRRFVMPAPLDWCRILGVEPVHSDPLTVDDLTSAKKTRMATHRELIKRRPGKYPRRWLAHRLGVRVETLDTYNREIPIHSRAQFSEKRIYWSSIGLVPDDMHIDGAFLEDSTGKRYPAKRAIAAKLLGQGKTIRYKRQDANYYWYGDCPPDLGVTYGLPARTDEPAPSLPIASALPMPGRADQFNMPAPKTSADDNLADIHRWTFKTSSYEKIFKPLKRLGNDESTPEGVSDSRLAWGFEPQATNIARSLPTAPASPKPKRLPTGRRRLKNADLENLACRVTEHVNRRAADPALHIGLAAARRLVSQYDRTLIDTTLGILEKRPNISKPAGFFVTVLRSEAKRKTLLGGRKV